jgi:hypothetical protein
MLKKAIQQGRGDDTTGGVAQSYVEDCVDPRTKLRDFFSIREGFYG